MLLVYICFYFEYFIIINYTYNIIYTYVNNKYIGAIINYSWPMIINNNIILYHQIDLQDFKWSKQFVFNIDVYIFIFFLFYTDPRKLKIKF